MVSQYDYSLICTDVNCGIRMPQYFLELLLTSFQHLLFTTCMKYSCTAWQYVFTAQIYFLLDAFHALCVLTAILFSIKSFKSINVLLILNIKGVYRFHELFLVHVNKETLIETSFHSVLATGERNAFFYFLSKVYVFIVKNANCLYSMYILLLIVEVFLRLLSKDPGVLIPLNG